MATIKRLYRLGFAGAVGALLLASTAAAADPVTVRCEAVNAIKPATDNVVGQALGFEKLVPSLILLGIILLIFLAVTSKAGSIMKGILTIAGLGIFLLVAQPFLSALFGSPC